MRRLLRVLGIAAVAMGLLFTAQGAGLVRWPPESFMINHHAWIGWGLSVVLAGIAAIIAARRI
jgi:hypothetical protein